MEIKTKFNLGDRVVTWDGRYKGTIRTVQTTTNDYGEPTVRYCLREQAGYLYEGELHLVEEDRKGVR